MLCLRKEAYNYWDGTCKEDPILKCQYNETTEWNFMLNSCVTDEEALCLTQQDMDWIDGSCVFSEDKQYERLIGECYNDRTKLLSSCLSENNLEVGQ